MNTRKKSNDISGDARNLKGNNQEQEPNSGAQPRRRGTPIETYKGDPDAARSDEEGDIEKETLDRHAPYNKTYGIADESQG